VEQGRFGVLFPIGILVAVEFSTNEESSAGEFQLRGIEFM
jgi:hypothetical protein